MRMQNIIWCVFLFLAFIGEAGAGLVSSNILQRVFKIKIGTEEGTCFAIEVDGRQYLITARHMLNNSTSNTANIYHDRQWKSVSFNRIDVEPQTVDIVVLAPDQQIANAAPVQPNGSKGAILSQEVFFVGFPFGLSVDGKNLNSGYPLPFVKHGVIAAFGFNSGEPFIVDAINNPGFSGSPVIIPEPVNNPIIIGVVSGYRWSPETVYLQGQQTTLSVQANTGLLIAFDLEYAINAIKKHPIGYPIHSP